MNDLWKMLHRWNENLLELKYNLDELAKKQTIWKYVPLMEQKSSKIEA